MCVEGILNSLPERYPSWLNTSYVTRTGKKLQMFIVLLPESVRESKSTAFISFPCGNHANFSVFAVPLSQTRARQWWYNWSLQRENHHPNKTTCHFSWLPPVQFSLLTRPRRPWDVMRRLATLADSDMFYCLFLFSISFGLSFSLSCSQRNNFFLIHAFETEFVRLWLNLKYSIYRLIRTLLSDSSDKLIYKVKWLYAHWLSSHGTFSFFYVFIFLNRLHWDYWAELCTFQNEHML